MASYRISRAERWTMGLSNERLHLPHWLAPNWTDQLNILHLLAEWNTHVISSEHSCALCIARHHHLGYWAQLPSYHNWTIFELEKWWVSLIVALQLRRTDSTDLPHLILRHLLKHLVTALGHWSSYQLLTSKLSNSESLIIKIWLSMSQGLYHLPFLEGRFT